jgi:hypothetical protein
MLDVTIVSYDIFSTQICHKVTLIREFSDKRYNSVKKTDMHSGLSGTFRSSLIICQRLDKGVVAVMVVRSGLFARER